MIIEGSVWKFGDDIDTDIIIASQYLHLPLEEYSKHLMEPVRPGFHSLVRDGDIIFAGKGFGIGSSRGQAVAALQKVGIKAVVAKSFGRIFFRSCINEGLPLIECPEACHRTDEGDSVEIDIVSGTVSNKTKAMKFDFKPYPSIVREILLAGGGIRYYKRMLTFNNADVGGVNR